MNRYKMKTGRIFIALLLLFMQQFHTSYAQTGMPAAKKITDHLQWVQNQLKHPGNDKVLIAAHRGDWRNAPENSLMSLKMSIDKRFDIVECDLGITKDGRLIILHDKTIDRTTNGKGDPKNYTLAELKKFRLKSGTGHTTRHEIPTFEEYLQLAKGKTVLCLDKAFEYFDAAMELVKKYQMEDQVIYNVPSTTLDSLRGLQLQYMSDRLAINLLGFPQDTARANYLAASYTGRGCTIFHPTFSSDTIALIKWLPSVKKRNIHLWLNALWPEHNGGHDDDIAVEENKPDETWGWLIKQGATIIQTDRPEELLEYLRKKGLHI